MSEDKFTNRHGHRVNVEKTDNAEVSKKMLPTAGNTSQAAAQAHAKRRFLRIRLSKKLVIPLLVVAGIGILAMFVTADSVKRDYERQTAAMRHTVAERGKQAMSSETAAASAATDLRHALSASTSCKTTGPDVVSWYGPAKQAREECQTTAEHYKKLQNAVDDMTAVAGYLQSANGLLNNAIAAPNDGGFAIIGDYADSWNQAVDGLQKLSPPESLKSSHQVLMQKSTAVRDAWNNVRDTYGAQKTDEFTASETKLSEAYADFRTSADPIHAVINSLQSSMTLYVGQLD